MFDFLERYRHYQDDKNHEWKANHTLYLQRLGFQGLGRGTWYEKAKADCIPVTRRGETFASFYGLLCGRAHGC